MNKILLILYILNIGTIALLTGCVFLKPLPKEVDQRGSGR